MELTKIKLNGTELMKPETFMPKREDVYAGEYTTCLGEIIADRIGWKYSDLTLQWDALPQDMVSVLVNMQGGCTLEFDDVDGSHTENIIRSSTVQLRAPAHHSRCHLVEKRADRGEVYQCPSLTPKTENRYGTPWKSTVA